MWVFSAKPDRDNPRCEDAFEALMQAREDAWALCWNHNGHGMCVIAPTLVRFAVRCADLAQKTLDKPNAQWCADWAVIAKNQPIRGALGAARHASICLKEDNYATVSRLLNVMCEEAKGFRMYEEPKN